MVAAADPAPTEVSGTFQIGDDHADGAFGDVEVRGEVAKPKIGSFGQHEEGASVPVQQLETRLGVGTGSWFHLGQRGYWPWPRE